MGEAEEHREEAAQMPDGDVVAILLRQHADIEEAMDRVTNASGDERATNFAALVQFLKAHEIAEQMVVRPVSSKTASREEAAERNAEEAQADKALAELVQLGAGNVEFGTKFSAFKKVVHEHAEKEEHEEFPTVEKECSDDERLQMGTAFLDTFSKAG